MSEKSLNTIRRASRVETWLSDERKDQTFQTYATLPLELILTRVRFQRRKTGLETLHCETAIIADAGLFG